ncbi:GntR family transcriptional regulator [Streptomyces armeniacus]|uniref:GntR family transcriptional regulator n=1 Tax=Streptomyces armeniacus TaxID=83291 RepID=A0A345XN68_9ACTN|nr:TetR/AcrR family transcriptional regulator C-terminal domain-containing protein [Streptomyces armeniacus]AXK33084.1 GntR family transcriptional regulator [Streptomyces armeniacus]
MTKPTEPSEQPPYLRIVAGIRRRIVDGELVPGDTVPSTRQIAREWGVALATATKALTTMRLEGLVETRPRSGTVVAGAAAVAPPRRRTSVALAPDQELSLDRIVGTAIDIADAEGLSALSMRGVAARLGVAAMSPYRYVPSKDDLVLLMADAAFGEVAYPEHAPEDWRASVELGARALWALYRKHPWLAQLGSLSRPLLVPNLMIYGEWVLGALDGHGLEPHTLFDIHLLIYSHVQGMAVHLEWEAQAEAATGQSEDQWRDSRAPVLKELVESGRIPTYARVMGGLGGAYELRLDVLFDLGLRALLDGMTPLVEGGRTER